MGESGRSRVDNAGCLNRLGGGYPPAASFENPPSFYQVFFSSTKISFKLSGIFLAKNPDPPALNLQTPSPLGGSQFSTLLWKPTSYQGWQ